MPQVKYLGYADNLTVPGNDKPVKRGESVSLDQNVIDDLLLRGHTFEGVAAPVVTLPAPHEVPDFEPEGDGPLSRAGALRRVQTAQGPALAPVDVDPPAQGMAPTEAPAPEAPARGTKKA
jgi:hypothetical protein